VARRSRVWSRDGRNGVTCCGDGRRLGSVLTVTERRRLSKGAVDFLQDFLWFLYYYFPREESLVADKR
jgi:hypothetical protein